MEPRDTVVWLGVAIGIVLTGFALFFYGQDRLTLGWFKSVSVHMKDGRLQANCKNSQINLILGQIQEVANSMPER